MNSLADNLVVTCHAIVDISKSAPINPSDEISCWLIAASLVLLLVIIVFKYCMKHRLTIPCLLSY